MSGADTTTPAPDAAANAGPPWPTDHPGRKCSLCKLGVYNLWIDTTPPPGTCVEGATSADRCRQNVGGAMWICPRCGCDHLDYASRAYRLPGESVQ